MFHFHPKPHFYKWPSQNIINFVSSSPPCSEGVTAKDPLRCIIAPDLSASLCFPSWLVSQRASQAMQWSVHIVAQEQPHTWYLFGQHCFRSWEPQQCYPALSLVVGQHSRHIIQRLPYSQGTCLSKIIFKNWIPSLFFTFKRPEMHCSFRAGTHTLVPVVLSC